MEKIKKLEIAGIVAILIGICLAIVLPIIFFSDIIGIEDDLSKIGTAFGGLVGSIWSLASVILFYIALSLQRQELALQRKELAETRKVFIDQSSTMKLQQNEATFFRLLDSHRDLINSIADDGAHGHGYSLLEYRYKTIKNSLKVYKLALEAEMADRRLWAHSPFLFIQGHGELFYQVINSTVSIIKFINERMENDPLYHEILFNKLSSPEKFLFGMYLHLIESKPEIKQIVAAAKYDYVRYYKGSDYFFDKAEGHLPQFEVLITNQNIWDITRAKYDDFPSIVLENKDEYEMDIRTVFVNFIPYGEKMEKVYEIKSTGNVAPLEYYEIDIGEILKPIYLDRIIKESNYGRVEVTGDNSYRELILNLDILFRGKRISYRMPFDMRVRVRHEDPPSLRLEVR